VSEAYSDFEMKTPWYIWCALLAVTSAAIGGSWDISWHMSIGRDTFWTPAHMAIYLCGVLAGIAFGYIILSTTFLKTAPMRDSSVHIWGFRAPLGAFIAAWGGIAMLTSAPFDNWWHDAYGLDVKIISPPHLVLFLGLYGVLVGTIVLIAGHTNRAAGSAKRLASYLLIYGCGILLIVAMTMVLQFTNRSILHTSQPYLVLSILVPVILMIAARASSIRFAATLVAAIYTFFGIALILILPLFPAEPKLGPVYQHVTHFIPEAFPILIIVPAFALDLVWQRAKTWAPWKIAAASSAVFLASLLAVQWPFASFLMSPAARNRFFGTMYLSYGQLPSSYTARYLFWPQDAAQFWLNIALALVVGFFTFRIGLSRGNWLHALKR
jgi:hypothetical protein